MPFRYDPAAASELRQGEILGPVFEYRTRNPTECAVGVAPLVDTHQHAMVVVVTADCDLLKDFKNRQSAATFRPADEVGHLHVCDLYRRAEIANLTPATFGAKERRRIDQNQDERYHRFPAATIGAAGVNLDELFLDFKRTFNLPTEQVYLQIAAGQTTRIARVPDVFLQDLAHRLFGYLSRVGPDFD